MIVFDLDGTLSNLQHRLHHIQSLQDDACREQKDAAYRAFFAACEGDDVIPQVKWVWDGLMEAFDLVVVTGRSDEVREDTIAWLVKNEFYYSYDHADASLYMREAGDKRPDTIVKSELMDQLISDKGIAPSLIFEDRKGVVDLWRERGFLCYQVAAGDF